MIVLVNLRTAHTKKRESLIEMELVKTLDWYTLVQLEPYKEEADITGAYMEDCGGLWSSGGL